MRLLLLLAGLVPLALQAQYLSVGPGAALGLAPGTTLAADTLRILPTGVVKHAAGGQSWLLVRGDVRNRGVYSKGLGTVRLVGSGPQRLDGPTAFYNLHLNNLAGATLRAGASAQGRLQLENGSIALGGADLYLYPGAGLYGSFDATTQLLADGAGRLVWGLTGPGVYTFPVGDATGTVEHTPLALTLTSGTLGTAPTLAVRLTNAKHPANSSPTHFLTRYWTVTETDLTAFDVDLTATYTDADVTGMEDMMVGAQYNGVFWTLLSPLAETTNTLSGNGISSFSDFTAGEPGSLPITLLTFTGQRTAPGQVVLRWTTASELNNDHFLVERSVGDASFAQVAVIGRVEGQGTTDALTQYTLTDADAPAVNLYYRLRQVDTDGTEHLSPAIEIGPLGSQTGLPEVLLYPNPTQGPVTLTLLGGGFAPTDRVTVRLTDAAGKQVAATELPLTEVSGYLSERLLASPVGVYILEVYLAGTPTRVRIVRR